MPTIRDLLQRRNKSEKDKEEEELQLALELSAKEQLNEQRRLLEQFSKKSQKRTSIRKQRIIKRERQPEEEEEDGWFQTVSSRPQKVVKKVKKESEPFQFDMDTIFQSEEEDDKAQMISDSDSDSSIIDLVNMAARREEEEEPPKEEEEEPPEEEEEDGYLSPLEGFKSLKEDANPSFLSQLQPAPKKKRGGVNTTSTGKNNYKRKNKWARKRKR
ncbi:hypothetical protein INT47_012046 [Mucor saturninus]|uniref:Uncharacterized protein n=1 Tax=Mucor saturninus TaxID=64648 RepID=A0A8H7UVE8_9FUNG|nr:hypothetical protein INT47_012046 [Mucor saturninus]